MKKQFRELPLGETFDFIHDEWFGPSFFLPCKKISPRKYVDNTGQTHEIGTVNATVHHVGEHRSKFLGTWDRNA